MKTEQDWLAQRMGNFTASEIWKLLTEPKTKADKDANKLSSTAEYYCQEKICELLTGQREDSFENNAMKWGNDNEPLAIEELRKYYDAIKYYGKENPKFFKFTEFSGGSPDGEFLNTHVIEIKCPYNSANHLLALDIKSGKQLEEYNKNYYYQLQFNMCVMAKENNKLKKEMKGLFVSYDPRFKNEKLQLAMVDVYPDLHFCDNIDKIINKAENYMRETILQIYANAK